MISVIVPIYNTEKYLRECISSILDQSYKDIELLLIDDGSDDGSLSICREYEKLDSRVKVFSKNNSGPFDTRKLGVMNAKGDYVTFVDSDDFIAGESYSIAGSDIEKDIDIICFGICRYYDTDNMIYDHDEYDEKEYQREEIEKIIFPTMIWDQNKENFGIDPSLCVKLFRRELITEIYEGISSLNFHYGEDVAVVYPAIYHAKSMAIHHASYYFHRHRKTAEIPSYLNDIEFPDKLYCLFRHLCSCFGNQVVFRRQTEILYAELLQLCKLKYGIGKIATKAVFPFDKVEKNEKIIIYGAGNIGRIFMDQLSRIKYCGVVLWVDRNSEHLGENISSPEKIAETDYDKIVIAIESEHIKNSVKKYLLESGVEEDRII